MTPTSQSDTPKLTFKVATRSCKYGDDRTFIEYQILMLAGKQLVGVEVGPRRTTVGRNGAVKAARARIRELKAHRLFAIRVTRKHISDGEARNCNTCAISQALWHNQERMGLSKQDYCFRVSPYASWVEPEGIVLGKKYGNDLKRLPVEQMPAIPWRRTDQLRPGRVYPESMVEWTMSWDEWAESRYMDLQEWREEHGYEDNERPCSPGPMTFVLDLDAFQEVKHD